MAASLSDLLAAAAVKVVEVELHGLTIRIRELTVEARAEFLRAHGVSVTAATAALLRYAVVGADGAPLLDEESAAQLASGSAALVQDLTSEILKVSGLSGGNE